MFKFPLPALLLCAVASHAGVVAPSAGPRAWSGPIVGAMSAAGLERISGLGSFSLNRLAVPDEDGRPALASPELLAPLVETLVLQKVDPLVFAALPTDAKLGILAAAAMATEDRLGRNAAALAAQVRNGIGRTMAFELTRAVREARETSLYLDAAGYIALASTEKSLSSFHAARREDWLAFHNLQRKIAAGAFDGSNLLVRDDLGDNPVWLAADRSPTPYYATPADVFASRILPLEKMAPSPWVAAEASLLIDALQFNLKNGTLAKSAWSASTLEALQSMRTQSAATLKSTKLARAAAHFSGKGKVTANDVLAVENYYYGQSIHTQMFNAPWEQQARMLATLYTGGFGLPDWKRLQAAKRKAAVRMQNLTVLSAVGTGLAIAWIASVALVGLAVGLSSLSAFELFFAAVSSAVIFIFGWAAWKLFALSRSRNSGIADLMGHHFD